MTLRCASRVVGATELLEQSNPEKPAKSGLFCGRDPRPNFGVDLCWPGLLARTRCVDYAGIEQVTGDAIMMYTAEQYHDQDTNRTRWAVLDRSSSVWYFPTQYGRKAAERMANQLNHQA